MKLNINKRMIGFAVAGGIIGLGVYRLLTAWTTVAAFAVAAAIVAYVWDK